MFGQHYHIGEARKYEYHIREAREYTYQVIWICTPCRLCHDQPRAICGIKCFLSYQKLIRTTRSICSKTKYVQCFGIQINDFTVYSHKYIQKISFFLNYCSVRFKTHWCLVIQPFAVCQWIEHEFHYYYIPCRLLGPRLLAKTMPAYSQMQMHLELSVSCQYL